MPSGVRVAVAAGAAVVLPPVLPPPLLSGVHVPRGMAVLPLKRDCALAPPTEVSTSGGGMMAMGWGSSGAAATWVSCSPPLAANQLLLSHLQGRRGRAASNHSDTHKWRRAHEQREQAGERRTGRMFVALRSWLLRVHVDH